MHLKEDLRTMLPNKVGPMRKITHLLNELTDKHHRSSTPPSVVTTSTPSQFGDISTILPLDDPETQTTINQEEKISEPSVVDLPGNSTGDKSIKSQVHMYCSFMPLYLYVYRMVQNKNEQNM